MPTHAQAAQYGYIYIYIYIYIYVYIYIYIFIHVYSILTHAQAAQYGMVYAIGEFRDEGIDLNAIDGWGRTALHHACMCE